jgi:hypothetical protein
MFNILGASLSCFGNLYSGVFKLFWELYSEVFKLFWEFIFKNVEFLYIFSKVDGGFEKWTFIFVHF